MKVAATTFKSSTNHGRRSCVKQGITVLNNMQTKGCAINLENWNEFALKKKV